MSEQESAQQIWLPVIGRALAYVCMRDAALGDKTIAEKAQFLLGLGLQVGDAAEMLGTSPASVYELLRLARNKKKKGGAKSAPKKKSSQAR